jgi:hypothetical protein
MSHEDNKNNEYHALPAIEVQEYDNSAEEPPVTNLEHEVPKTDSTGKDEQSRIHTRSSEPQYLRSRDTAFWLAFVFVDLVLIILVLLLLGRSHI